MVANSETGWVRQHCNKPRRQQHNTANTQHTNGSSGRNTASRCERDSGIRRRRDKARSKIDLIAPALRIEADSRQDARSVSRAVDVGHRVVRLREHGPIDGSIGIRWAAEARGECQGVRPCITSERLSERKRTCKIVVRCSDEEVVARSVRLRTRITLQANSTSHRCQRASLGLEGTLSAKHKQMTKQSKRSHSQPLTTPAIPSRRFHSVGR